MPAEIGPGGSGDRFSGLLPAELIPLFDDRFARSCTLFEEYVHRLALRVVVETGIGAAAREPGTRTPRLAMSSSSAGISSA